MIDGDHKMMRLGVLLCLAGVALASPPVIKTREEIEEFRKNLENSRIDNGASVDARISANPEANVWENSGKFEGDIVLNDEQIEELVDEFATGRTAYTRPHTRWPNNVVVWEFGDYEFTHAQQRAIIESINLIQHFTCVRFRTRTPQDRDFVRLTGGPAGCYASVGFQAGRGIHTMNLARSTPGHGCFMVAVIIHEWLHVLGFFHMQSTYNRDHYVRINEQNIIPGMQHNFYRYGSNMVSNLRLPYEYTSCMHYGSHAFSRNGQPTITPLRSFPGQMGQLVYVTYTDWLRVRRHYNCPGAWSDDEVKKLEEEVQRYYPLDGKTAPPKPYDARIEDDVLTLTTDEN